MSLEQKNILAIEDAAAIRTFLRISLQAHGASFFEAANASEGVRLCEEINPDLVVLDLGLPDKDGLEILPLLKQKSNGAPPPKVVILSVRKEQSTKNRALSLGADAYLTKPFLMEELIEVIERKLNTMH